MRKSQQSDTTKPRVKNSPKYAEFFTKKYTEFYTKKIQNSIQKKYTEFYTKKNIQNSIQKNKQNFNKKMSLPLIQINGKCEVPFYFVCICQKCYIICV